jgi:RNA polymerase sigma-70 factor (ECF subfamily)
MGTTGILEKARAEGWTDEEVVGRVRSGDTALYEIIMRRYNQRLYRVARAIVREDSEAEDVMQDVYVRAYENLGQFANRAPFAAWLTRIAVHEALRRVRKRNRTEPLDDSAFAAEYGVNMVEASPDPEQVTTRAELRQLLADERQWLDRR